MKRDRDHAPGRMLAGWIGGMHRGAGWVVAAAIAASAMSLWFTASNLGINTDTTDMIDETLPFRQAVKDYDRAFPLSIDTLILVIDGETPDLAEDAATQLAERHAVGHGQVSRRQAILDQVQDARDIVVDPRAERLELRAPLLGRAAACRDGHDLLS